MWYIEHYHSDVPERVHIIWKGRGLDCPHLPADTLHMERKLQIVGLVVGAVIGFGFALATGWLAGPITIVCAGLGAYVGGRIGERVDYERFDEKGDGSPRPHKL